MPQVCSICAKITDDIEIINLHLCKECLSKTNKITFYPKANDLQPQTRNNKKETTKYIATISQRTQNQLQYLCIFGVLGVFFYLFSSLNFSNPMSIFHRTDVLINGTLGIIAVWFCWKLFRNELRYKFKIEPNSSVRERFPPLKNKDIKSIFPLVGLILCLPFVILNIIYIWVSYPEGQVTIIYDHFGELLPELLLFNALFVIILFLTYKTYKNLKTSN